MMTAPGEQWPRPLRPPLRLLAAMALLGTLLLGEPYGPQRVLGSALIAGGLALLVIG